MPGCRSAVFTVPAVCPIAAVVGGLDVAAEVAISPGRSGQ